MEHRSDALSRPRAKLPQGQGQGQGGRGKWPRVVVFLLALAELAWFRWYLFEPLPYAKNLGQIVRRWMLLVIAFPEIMPGVSFARSHLGIALRELSHVENLPQRLPIAAAAGLIAVAALALGSLVLRGLRLRTLVAPAERLALAFLLGTSGLGVATLLAGRLGALSPWTVRIALGILVLVEIGVRARGREFGRPRLPAPAPAPASVALGLIVAPFLLLMALGAMLPTIDFDATEYHLEGPKEYYLAGRIAFLPHNVYASMPFGVEMLHLLGMELLDDWWWGALAGQLLVACFAPAAAVLVAAAAQRWGTPRAAWFAALVYLTTPWIYRLAVLPYVEGPLCAYHAALIWAAGRAWTWTENNTASTGVCVRLWGLTGLLAGGAMACKYPALVSAVVPFGLLALADSVRKRSAWLVLAYAAGWGAIMTPWLAKNVIDTGNPVYPLAYRVFGGRDWDEAREAQWNNVHGPRPITAGALATALVDVSGRSDWQSPLYAMLAPLALLRRGGRRTAGALWGYAAYLFLTWWLLTHRLDRFWLPLLPALAILAGLGADWTRDRAWSIFLGGIVAVALVLNLVMISTSLTGLNEWTGDLNDLRIRVPTMINGPLARLDTRLPAGARVLLVGQAGVFHLNHDVVYSTVFDHEILETLARGRTPAEVGRALHERGVTHVYVDWSEIERYRSPGNYGFTPFITPRVFTNLVAAGVLEPVEAIGPRQDLYRVR